MFQFVNHFSTKKSYVYFTIPHSSYYQLLFNTNTTIYLHNFPPLSLILYFFPFIFFPCYYSPSSHSQRTYLPFVPKPLLQQSQQTSPNLHFASPSSYPRLPFSPNTYEYSHPPPETRGCAKFSPIIRLNICLLTHTHTQSVQLSKIRGRIVQSVPREPVENRVIRELHARRTSDPHRTGNFDSFTLLANSFHRTVFQD